MSQQKIAVIAAPGTGARMLALAIARNTPVDVDVLVEDATPKMPSAPSGYRPYLGHEHPDDPTGWSRAARRSSKTHRRKLFRA